MGLSKVPCVGSSDRNAGDGQAGRAGILECHTFGRACGADPLSGEGQTGGRQCSGRR